MWAHVRLWWRPLVRWIPGAPAIWCPECGSRELKAIRRDVRRESQTPQEWDRGIFTVVEKRHRKCRDCNHRWVEEEVRGTVDAGRPLFEATPARTTPWWKKAWEALHSAARSFAPLRWIFYVVCGPFALIGLAIVLLWEVLLAVLRSVSLGS